jgi:hypothetical protein
MERTLNVATFKDATVKRLLDGEGTYHVRVFNRRTGTLSVNRTYSTDETSYREYQMQVLKIKR